MVYSIRKTDIQKGEMRITNEFIVSQMINCIIVEIILLNSFKMTKSNPQIVLDSFALTKSFQMGNAVKNSLVPDGFTKSQHFYLKTWREQSAQNGD